MMQPPEQALFDNNFICIAQSFKHFTVEQQLDVFTLLPKISVETIMFNCNSIAFQFYPILYPTSLRIIFNFCATRQFMCAANFL